MPYTDGQIMPGVFQHSYQKREASSEIINLLFNGFTYNTRAHFAPVARIFLNPEKNIRAYYM